MPDARPRPDPAAGETLTSLSPEDAPDLRIALDLAPVPHAPPRPRPLNPSTGGTVSVTAPPPATRTTPAPPRRSGPPDRATAVAAVSAAVLFTGAFTLLGVTFDYPAVLDESAGEILTRYAAADTATRVLWYVMVVASLAFVPLAVLLGRSTAARLPAPSALTGLTVVIGVLAGAVQAVGFARWTFAVPHLSATWTDPAATPATRDAVVVAFEVLHRFVGGALGEHLGFALTAAWAVGTAVLLARAPGVPRLLPVVGVLSAAAIATGTLEATGAGWPGIPVAVGYTAFAAWLVWIGVLVAVRPAAGRAR